MLLNVSKIMSYGMGFIFLAMALVILFEGYGTLALLMATAGAFMFGGGLLMSKALESSNRWAASLEKDAAVIELESDHV